MPDLTNHRYAGQERIGKIMDYGKYKSMPNAQIPPEIAAVLPDGGNIHLTPFEDKDTVLLDPVLQAEAGFQIMDNGDYQVSMYCPMPGVKKEMIDWWFWWHPQENERYQLWFPGEHFSIKTDKKDADYFSATTIPPFRPNSQYPTEKVGNMKMPLRIDFVTPQQFGFSEDAMREGNVATIVCGHVGAFRGAFYHTEMAHIYFRREGGLFMVSRFWIGRLLKNGLIRKAVLTENMARGMAQHCCIEYRNLAAKLPLLYQEAGGAATPQ